MILQARHHPVIDPFFTWYVNRSVKRHFHSLRFIPQYTERGLPILMIANHMSWWDGMWLRSLNARYFRRSFNFMMLEEQLRKHWYFQHIGGFSVKKGTRSVIESLDHAAELLSDPGNLVLMFPQGEIQSMHTRHFHFEKGILQILRKTDIPVQFLMTANIVDYFSHKKPSLFCYVRELENDIADHRQLEIEYREFYHECLSDQAKIREI